MVAKAVAESPPIPDYTQRINKDHFVVNEGGKAVVYRETYDDFLKRPKLERMTFEDFSKLHRNERVPVINSNGNAVDKQLGAAWLDCPERRQYLGGIVFDPTGAARPDKFNLWRGFSVEAKPGNWECMRTHIWEVICAKDEAIGARPAT